MAYGRLTEAEFRAIMMAVTDYGIGLADNGENRELAALNRAWAKIKDALQPTKKKVLTVE